MIGSNIGNTIATTTLPVSAASRKEGSRIISRSGLERQGRFQHGTISYLVELSSLSSPQETTVVRVTFEEILDFVALPELERFENAQFEQELVYQECLLLNTKKRGRPPKAALVCVGLSSDESEPDIIDDGIAVVIPSGNARKRPHSPPAIRRRGRPRKDLSTNEPGYEHVPLPQVNTRAPRVEVSKSSGFRRSPFFPTNSHHADEDELIDAASSQLLDDGEDYHDELGNTRQDSLPATTGSNSKFKISSALVAAPVATNSEDDEDLDSLHQRFAAKKAGPGRPRKSPKLITNTEDSRLNALHTRSQGRKPGRPRKYVGAISQIAPEKASSTEDELLSLHQQFGVSPRQVTKSVGTNNRLSSDKEDLQKDSMKTSILHNSFGSKPHAVKPGPGKRPGYRVPSLSKEAILTSGQSTADSDSSAAPPEHEQRSSLFTQNKSSSAPIEISDDESSDSFVAVSSHMQSVRERIPKPFQRSKPNAASSIKPKPQSMTSKGVSNPADLRRIESGEDEQSQSSEEEEADDDILALNFPIADVPSSQSYIAQPSTSSDTDRERFIRADEITKTRKAAGSPRASDRRLSKTSRTQPDSASSGTQSTHPAQSVSRGRKSHPIRPRSHPATSLPIQNNTIPTGLRPSMQAFNKSPSSSSSSDSTSSDDSAMIATIKKNPSLFDRPPMQDSRRPRRNTATAAPRSAHTIGAPQRQLPVKAPWTNLPSSKTAKEANSRPFLPFTKPKTQSRRRPSTPELPSSPSMSIHPNRQLSVSLSSPPQRQASISLGESSPPPQVRGREASMSLGATPSPPRRIITPQTKPATASTGASAGLSLAKTPLHGSTSTPQTAFKNGKARAGNDGKQDERSNQEKTAIKKSMTPLYPGLLGMPFKKKRTMFGTQEE